MHKPSPCRTHAERLARIHAHFGDLSPLTWAERKLYGRRRITREEWWGAVHLAVRELRRLGLWLERQEPAVPAYERQRRAFLADPEAHEARRALWREKARKRYARGKE